MRRTIIRSEGALQVQPEGEHRYRISVSVPGNDAGRVARKCPDPTCLPGSFTVKPGTGQPEPRAVTYCPYCRHAGDAQLFATTEQMRYAKDLLMRQVQHNVDDMIRDALKLDAQGKRKLGGGMLSMQLSFKPAAVPPVQLPVEEDIRRDVACPACGLDHTVFGMANWCSDCGSPMFLTHVASELDVLRGILGDLDRRRETLGWKAAARDLGNCLEDAVSVFEAAMKAMTRRHLMASGLNVSEVQSRLKKIGNAFQSVDRTADVLREQLGVAALPSAPWPQLKAAFEKRHPITHNLGVVDQKYLDRTQGSEREGHELSVSSREVHTLLDDTQTALKAVHDRLF